ncbi:hypothetical protein [Pontibacter mucosus]|nr:hypothetical protein [Pontibacter mucosus]
MWELEDDQKLERIAWVKWKEAGAGKYNPKYKSMMYVDAGTQNSEQKYKE